MLCARSPASVPRVVSRAFSAPRRASTRDARRSSARFLARASAVPPARERVASLESRAPTRAMAPRAPARSRSRSSARARASSGGADDAAARYGLANAERGVALRWLPTFLTLLRVAAVPLLAAVYYSDLTNAAPIAGTMFIGAAITDWLDGYLARRLKASSAFGAFLDPVADKLMVAASLCLLCTHAPRGVAAWAVAVPSIVIIGREITMSALREWCAAKGGEAHAAVKVNNLGKYKTATQMVALSVLLLVRDGSDFFANGAHDALLVRGGVWCLWISAALALISLWVYMSGVIGIMLKSDD